MIKTDGSKLASESQVAKMFTKGDESLAYQKVHLELPSQQTNCTVCWVPSECSECSCRLGFTNRQGEFRMETKCFIFLRDCNTHEAKNSGSVSIWTLRLTTTIHCMETRFG